MDDKKTNIIYTKADIDNYLQGKMSKEAMHSFERVALQDAFLADAIEGYHFVNSATANNDLAAIEAFILADKQETKIVPIANKTKPWLRVAAVAILLAGVGIVSILVMKKADEKLVVSNMKSATEKADSTISDTNHRAVAFEPVPPTRKEVIENKSSQKSITTKDETIATAQSQQVSSVGSISTNQNATSSKYAGPSVNNFSNNYVASVGDLKTDNNIKESEIKREDAAKDFKGTYSNKATNIAAENMVVELPTIRLQSDSSYDKIPVTVYASKKNAAKPLAFRLTKEDSSLVPANGWAAFNDYLQHNNTTNITYDTISSPVTIINNKTGEEIVGLEFDIDKFGVPDKIKITKSVDPETDAKAIDLLKKGPKWITTDRNQKGKIAIKF